MKKLFTIMLGLMLSVTAIAQKTVAVYVTSSEGVSNETKRILGSELVAAITKTNEYVAVERTADFMAQVSKEQGNYEIDDAKLYDLGRKFGASNVCVADVTKFGDEYYIVARLLDIKTSKVWRTSKKYAKLASLRELVETSEAVANELFGQQKEFSTYAYGDNVDNKSYLMRIENRGSFTKVTLKYLSIDSQQRLGISGETYIEDLSTHNKYQLVDASNINIIDQNNKKGRYIGSCIWEYSLFFDRMPEDAQNIKIVEPHGREYKDIVLKPYGEPNVFVFEDKTQMIYSNMQDNKSAWQPNQEVNEIITIRGDYYYLGDKRITKVEYRNLMETCPEAWAKYKKGKTLNAVGWIAMCAVAGGGFWSYMSESSALYVTMGGCAALSVSSFIIAKNHKKNAYKEYNNHCAKPATLSMGITSNGGVGFTLNF